MFDDAIKTVNDGYFDVFGEPVTVIEPDGVTTRAVTGVVDRNPAADLGQMGSSWAMEIDLPNDATLGIAAAEFTGSGQWQVQVPVRIGDTAATRTVSRIVSQDAAVVRWAVH